MRRFWNARAREDAYFFVDDRRSFGDPDLAQFWKDGELDLDRLLQVLEAEVRPEDVVLDIGCGVGRLTRVLAGRARIVYGLDISAEMLERAHAHNEQLANVQWVEGDGESLAPLPDASVDACVSHVVFQHIPDPSITMGYVREMGRVLKPGGWAAFQVSNDPRVHRPRRPRGAWLHWLVPLLRPLPRGQDDPAWIGSSVSMPELRAVARDSGLELERVVGEGTQFCAVLVRRTGS
jgi:SAM-dependent methyltransferase